MGNSEAGHKATVERTKTEGAKRVRIHILLDGRDLPETSALDYVEPFEALLTGLNGCEPQLPDRRGGRHPPLWRCSIRMSTSTASSSRVSSRRILQERRRFTQAVRPTRSGSPACQTVRRRAAASESIAATTAPSTTPSRVSEGDRGSTGELEASHPRAARYAWAHCCSRGSMTSFRSSAHAASARCESVPSSPTPVPCAGDAACDHPKFDIRSSDSAISAKATHTIVLDGRRFL